VDGRVNPYFEDLEASPNLGGVAKRGAVASVASVYGRGVLQIFGSIVLARLLTPADFGLVAIVMVLTRFAPLLIDFGFADATTQRSSITQSQCSTLFWLNSGIGFAVALSLAVCSPLIAWVYHDPRLQPIALLFAITFAFNGLSAQHLSLLRRAMQFAEIAKIQILGALAAVVVGTLTAAFDYGYWALVWQAIANAACTAVGAWLACSWRPGLPVFDVEVKSMIRFGMHVLTYSIIYSMAKVTDRITLGLFYPPGQVGVYQNAINMYENALLGPLAKLHDVASSGLSKLRSDPAELRQKYEVSLSTLAFFVMPAAAILSVTAQDLTVVLFGNHWRESGVLLSIIALGGIVEFIESSQGWLHISNGTPERWKKSGFIGSVVRVVLVLAGLPFGAEGVAIAIVVANWLIAFPSIIYAGFPMGISARLIIRAVGGPMFGSAAVLALGWWLQTTFALDVSRPLRILLLASCCSSIYFLIVVCWLRIVVPVRIVVNLLKDFVTRSARRRP
jgi:O-antigen/teichoic acid export membrane protein